MPMSRINLPVARQTGGDGDVEPVNPGVLADWVRRATERDPDAFAQLYDHYANAIYRYCAFQVPRPADAEDLTTQVFLRAWQAIDRYRVTERPFSAWLYRIARNAAVDYHRAASRHVPLPDEADWPSGNAEPAALVEGAEMTAALQRALGQLRAEERQVILLRFIEGLSHDQVAAVTGKSVGALRILQHRTLKKLRHILRGR
jgi:RNA polymerase sigma-70 factor (ECF subfamily)